MKILYGITKSNFGGAQRYVFDLATEMKKREHEVAVLCGQSGLLTDKLKKEKIKILKLDVLNRDISLISDLRSFFEIYKILKKESPDIFHINSSKMGGIGAFTARLVGIKKIIFTSHGWAFNEPRPWWQKITIMFFTWLIILFSHKTICVSEKTKEQIARWPFVKNKLVIIHNGISKFELVKHSNQKFTVGTIAELHVIKGLDVLLKAWSKFVKGHEAKLVIIGTGEERENLENMARQLNILESVDFKGFVDNARAELSSFDIFCLPSRSEAMPYVLLEAGLVGLPIVASRVGGIPEVIESGVSGILVPVEDSEVIFSTLILLKENADLRERLGRELRKKIMKEFSLEEMIRAILKIYELKL